MRWIIVFIVAASMAALLAYFYAPLASFNFLVIKDKGSRQIARGISYGPLKRQKLDIYRPVSAETLPVIMFFYGGAWSAGSRYNYSFMGRALAAQGFVTVIADYRLVPEVRFPDFLRDGAAATKWVRHNIAHVANGDPSRIILMGHSAGAYNAAMLALDPRWLGRDRAAIRGFIGLAGPYDFLPLDDPATLAAFSSWPIPRETQPVSFASPDDPPALLATGDSDKRVRAHNSDSLAKALTAQHVFVERLRYKGADHAQMILLMSRPLRSRASLYNDVIGFARRVSGTTPSTDRSSS